MGQPNALGGHLVKVRGANSAGAEAGEVAMSHIIDHHEDDVGAAGILGLDRAQIGAVRASAEAEAGGSHGGSIRDGE